MSINLTNPASSFQAKSLRSAPGYWNSKGRFTVLVNTKTHGRQTSWGKKQEKTLVRQEDDLIIPDESEFD